MFLFPTAEDLIGDIEFAADFKERCAAFAFLEA
jgi:hypothetical protein